MNISYQAQAKVSKDIIIREIADEAVILNLKSESYYALNDVGNSMWLALTKNSSIENAYQQLLGEFDVDAKTLRQDLDQLITDLIDKGMLEIA